MDKPIAKLTDVTVTSLALITDEQIVDPATRIHPTAACAAAAADRERLLAELGERHPVTVWLPPGTRLEVICPATGDLTLEPGVEGLALGGLKGLLLDAQGAPAPPAALPALDGDMPDLLDDEMPGYEPAVDPAATAETGVPVVEHPAAPTPPAPPSATR